MADLTDDQWEEIARRWRRAAGMDDALRLDAAEFVRWLKREGYIKDYVCVPDEKLPTSEGKYDPDKRTIFYRQSIWNAGERSDPHAMWTLIHEACHFILGHKEVRFRANAFSKNRLSRRTTEDEIAVMRGGNWRSGRHLTGSVVYWTVADNPESAWDASELFLSRELWANDFYHVNPERDLTKQFGFPFVPTGAVEEVFIDTFINFVQVARSHLGMTPPVRIIAGLAGMHGFRLAVDAKYFGFSDFAGRILRDNLVLESMLNEWSTEPFDFLLPFFKKMYDAAGLVRPAIRTVGRRQR
jgi:hypothetical protein